MDDDDDHGENGRETDVTVLKRLLAERLRATREFQRVKAGLLGRGSDPNDRRGTDAA